MANFAGRTKFTDGDWKVGPEYEVGTMINGPEGWLGVACAYGDTPEEEMANAQLIACSTKMFWKLADVLLALEEGGLRKPKQWEASIRATLEEAIRVVPQV